MISSYEYEMKIFNAFALASNSIVKEKNVFLQPENLKQL
jgi:hypothetical protein